MKANFFLAYLVTAAALILSGCDLDANSDASAPLATALQERHAGIVAGFQNYDPAAAGEIDIVFIGDSITHIWEFSASENGGFEQWEILKQTWPRIYNLGFGGDQTGHVIWRLNNGEFPVHIKPRFAVLMIGTNNISAGFSPENIAGAIKKICAIIRERSGSTKIILLSIIPRGDSSGANAKVGAVNNIIRTYNDMDNVIYYDLGQFLVTSNGALKGEFYWPDKLHLSTAGYELWREKLELLLKQ
jgi:lysophospholipase L1-like esterase